MLKRLTTPMMERTFVPWRHAAPEMAPVPSNTRACSSLPAKIGGKNVRQRIRSAPTARSKGEANTERRVNASTAHSSPCIARSAACNTAPLVICITRWRFTQRRRGGDAMRALRTVSAVLASRGKRCLAVLLAKRCHSTPPPRPSSSVTLSRSVFASAVATTNTAKSAHPSGRCTAIAPASSSVSVIGTGKPATLKITSPATISTNSGAGNSAAACNQATPFIPMPSAPSVPQPWYPTSINERRAQKVYGTYAYATLRTNTPG
jgi:hypothetical protein